MTVDEVSNKTQDENRRRRRSRSRTVQETAEVAVEPGQSARKDRPTPSQRERSVRRNFISRAFGAVAEYFRETRGELQKVTWPTRQEALRLSGIVLAVTIAFSLGLGLLDFLYGELFRLGFSNIVVFIIFAVVAAVAVGASSRYLRQHDI